MPTYDVAFKGSLGNLAQWTAAIENAVARETTSLSRVAASIPNLVAGGARPLTSDSGAGVFYSKLRTELDATNRTFIHQADVVHRVLSGYEVEIDKVTNLPKVKEIFTQNYHSSVKKAIGDVDAYEKAIAAVAPTEQKVLAVQKASVEEQVRLGTQLVHLSEQQEEVVKARGTRTNPLVKNVEAAKRALAEFDTLSANFLKRLEPLSTTYIDPRGQLRLSEAAINPATGKTVPANFPVPKALLAANAQPTPQAKIAALLTPDELAARNRFVNNIAVQEAALAKAAEPYAAQLKIIDEEQKQISADIRTRIALEEAATAALRTGPAYANLAAAENAVPPINKKLNTFLTESASGRQELLKAGLGAGTTYGTSEFQKALADQEASVHRYTENIRNGVRTIQGSWTDASGVEKQFTIETDKNGNALKRMGGNFLGANSILRQTVRDFQKVIEWTVATTLVFGTLATVVGQLKSINELNSSLQRLSITAQTSAEDTAAIFKSLGEVAISTATPLKEIVKVADDIALATRVATDSTEEWRQKIVSMTEAVGIFTNLAGVDTVQAADQLSAAFKQLEIAPNELIGLLSKVTAVAGGQATAIADIVKGVSTVAEAAKGAGLTVDQQIASIQVLSQVTNKTSSEIAVSFKNLFGSVSSVGSEKILKEFNIAVRDAQGGIRDFLDIYRDVQDAIEKGVIPQNRIPDVLRGLSGGPRRAPDAAALLANIGRIDEVVTKSQNATNEALIANAKILDTNTAKITQFQNAIDIALFEKFGATVKDLVETFTTLGGTFAEFFNSVPQQFVDLAVKLGGLALGIKVLGSVIKLAFGKEAIAEAVLGLTTLNARLATLATSGVSATGAITRVGATLRAAATGRSAKVLAGLTAGAAVAGGVLAGGDTNTIGTLLQTGGLAATLVPVPGFQAAGLAAVGLGTILQILAGDSTKVEKSQRDAAISVYGFTQALKEAQETANKYSADQTKAGATIDTLSAKSKRTADEQARLSAATADFAAATLGLATANKELNRTFDDLFDSMKGLNAERYKFLQGIGQGTGISADVLAKLQAELSRDILQGTGQDIYSASTQAKISSTYRAGLVTGQQQPERQPIVVSPRGRPDLQQNVNGLIAENQPTNVPQPKAPPPQTFDFSTLFDRPELLDKLFNPQGKIITGEGSVDRTNLKLIQSALSQLPKLVDSGKITQERYQQLVDAVQSLAQSASSFDANVATLTQQQASIQSKGILGIFSQKEVANATLANTLAQQLNANIPTFKAPINDINVVHGQAPQALVDAQKQIAALADAAEKGTELSNEQLINVGKQILIVGNNFDILKDKGEEALNRGIVAALENAHVPADRLDGIIRQLGLDFKIAKEASDELVAAMENARQTAGAAFGNRALNLVIAKNSGQYDDDAEALKKLTQQNNEAYKSELKLIDALSKLSGTEFLDLNNALSQAIGLQGEYTTANQFSALSIEDQVKKQEEFGAKLIENAISAGVNAEGISKITDELVKLTAAILAVPVYKKVVIELEQISNVNETVAQGGTFSRGQIAAIQQIQASLPADQKAAAAELKKLTDQFNTSYNKQLEAGNLLTKKTTGGAKSTDIVDIPEEIAKQKNLNALLQEAVRNARRLQGTIPGATKEAKGQITDLLKGTQNVLEIKGIKTELIRKALDEIAARFAKQVNEGLDISTIDIPDLVGNADNRASLLQQAIKNAKDLQNTIPEANKEAQNDVVELLKGTKNVLEVRGIKDDLLRKALDELADQIKRQNDLLAKADTLRRIHVFGGDFSSIATVPVNSASGVSVGGPNAINVTLNVNGTVLTPAQLSQFANTVGAAIKRQFVT